MQNVRLLLMIGALLSGQLCAQQSSNSSSSDQDQDTAQQSSSSSKSSDQSSSAKEASESSAQGSAASNTNQAPEAVAVYGQASEAPKSESHSKEQSKEGHEKSDTKPHEKNEKHEKKEEKKEEPAESGKKEKEGQGKKPHEKEKSSNAQAKKSEAAHSSEHDQKHQHASKKSADKPVEQVQAMPEEKVQIMGIDTVDISEPKGNWLYKRIWWEKAERLYEKIKNMTDQIYEARMIFFSRRTELDRNVLDPFYLSVGLNQGELTQILTYYTLFIDKERAANKELESKERQFFDMLVLEKKNLEALNSSVQNVLKLDQAIDTALMKLMEQINLSRNYERQSWNNFKDINRELSDKKAREDYYKMDTSWKNVNNINSYIASQFTQYFDELVNKIVQETEGIKSQVKALREKGIDITEQGQQLASQGALKFSSERPEEEAKEVQEEGSRSFWTTVAGYIKTPFAYVYGLVADSVSWFGSLFGFGHEESEETEPAAQKNEKPVAKKEEKAAQTAPPVHASSPQEALPVPAETNDAPQGSLNESEPPPPPAPTQANEAPQDSLNESVPQNQAPQS
jgi:hypothetical protein